MRDHASALLPPPPFCRVLTEAGELAHLPNSPQLVHSAAEAGHRPASDVLAHSTSSIKDFLCELGREWTVREIRRETLDVITWEPCHQELPAREGATAERRTAPGGVWLAEYSCFTWSYCCIHFLQKFLENPELYVPPLAPHPLPPADMIPKRLTLSELKSRFPKCAELQGYCPVTYQDGNHRQVLALRGGLRIGSSYHNLNIWVKRSLLFYWKMFHLFLELHR